MISAVVDILRNHTGVQSIVGQRIFNRWIPQRRNGEVAVEVPLVVLSRDATERLYSLDGYSELANTSLLVMCFADSYAQVEDLAAEVKSALLDYTGTAASIRIQTIQLTNDSDDDELQLLGTDKRYLFREMNFNVHWDEN